MPAGGRAFLYRHCAGRRSCHVISYSSTLYKRGHEINIYIKDEYAGLSTHINVVFLPGVDANS
jgi:hypothetical protein